MSVSSGWAACFSTYSPARVHIIQHLQAHILHRWRNWSWERVCSFQEPHSISLCPTRTSLQEMEASELEGPCHPLYPMGSSEAWEAEEGLPGPLPLWNVMPSCGWWLFCGSSPPLTVCSMGSGIHHWQAHHCGPLWTGWVDSQCGQGSWGFARSRWKCPWRSVCRGPVEWPCSLPGWWRAPGERVWGWRGHSHT